MSDRGYKRSWKNLLINKRYQLRFTLFMVGLAAVMMALLGWWVVRVANEATTVAQSSIRGEVCPPLPKAMPPTPPTTPAPPTPAPPTPGAGPGSSAATDPGSVVGAEPIAGSGPGTVPPDDSADPSDPDGSTRRRSVVIQESKIDIEVTPPAVIAPDHAQQIAAHHECELKLTARIAEVGSGKRRILYVMIASGVLLTLGLAVFGIKMTHRVAGPLYKVTLYLAKLREGRYDKVYDLRKGDQLVEFYEHFKHAHAGVVVLEQADVERIRAALDAATVDGVAERSDDAKAAAAALRDVLARKEKSLG